MSKATATLPQFQTYVWEMLPMRKEALGREMVNDIVIAVVQFWPNEELCRVEQDTDAEADLLRSVSWSVKRVLTFIYGPDRFGGYWLLGAKSLIPMIVEITRQWWRKRKDNRAKIGVWRRKWVYE